MDLRIAILQLLLATAAGALLGFERELHGRAAGFRTTTLVSFASCLLMIASNYGFAGSYDTSRVAAGIVSGMGFLGAGAIVRHSERSVQGVTTAATLWSAMAIGLAFGACGPSRNDFLWFGAISTAIAYAVLGAFHLIEKRILSNRYVEFAVSFDGRSQDVESLMAAVGAFPTRIVSLRYGTDASDGLRRAVFTLCYKAQRAGKLSVPLTDKIATLPGVRSVEWRG